MSVLYIDICDSIAILRYNYYVDQNVGLTSWDLLKLTSITEGGSEDRGHACSSKRVHQVYLLYH